MEEPHFIHLHPRLCFSCKEEPVDVVWDSPWIGASGMSNWEETQRKTHNVLDVSRLAQGHLGILLEEVAGELLPQTNSEYMEYNGWISSSYP